MTQFETIKKFFFKLSLTVLLIYFYPIYVTKNNTSSASRMAKIKFIFFNSTDVPEYLTVGLYLILLSNHVPGPQQLPRPVPPHRPAPHLYIYI